MIPPFVKKFDFRGIYNKDITDADAYFLGIALQKIIPIKKVLVGWDTRPSSKNLAINFINALQDKGIEISYVDKCPIDYVTAAAFACDFDLSVMFTGSHNPQNWTGMLLHTKGGDSIQGELVGKIIDQYFEAKKQPFAMKNLDLLKFHDFRESIEKIYGDKIQSLIPLSEIKKLRVLVDIGDGSGSQSLSLVENLLPQVTFTRINDRKIYDEASSHIADPSEIENMKELISFIKEESYACGFAFDSDADRVLAVDENGAYVNGSLLGSAMIESFSTLETFSDTRFGYAVDCGPSMHNAVTIINKETGKNVSVEPIPVGRSIMRKMLRDKTIDFAVENVGHFYSKDFFMTDSGAFSLILILYWISQNGPLSTLFQKYPDGKRDQIFSPVSAENRVEKLEKEINAHFANLTVKKIEVDGVRYEFYEGEYIKSWYAVRKSGYEAIEKYYFGSIDESEFGFLKTTIEGIIKNY